MILVDVNLLLYAHVASFPQHDAAREWLDAHISGAKPVGLPWPSLLGFVRLVSNPRVFERPSPIADAWRQVESWLDADATWIPQPTERHRTVLAPLLKHVEDRPQLVPDAHLAALAIEHELVLCSTDSDFARFSRLDWLNPLA